VDGEQNKNSSIAGVSESLKQLEGKLLSPLDLLPHKDLREKLVELVLADVPDGIPTETASDLQQVKDSLEREPVADLNVVVFGGGTGLSTIIGGDSRSEAWTRDPFSGLKELFPNTRSIVCITDDGGSTGELLKDLPLIALGDIRHVLISSIQLANLKEYYGLSTSEASKCVGLLASVFNYRFAEKPKSYQQLLTDCGLNSQKFLPLVIQAFLEKIIENLFVDKRLSVTLERPHCLGNLILASSIYEQIPEHFTNTSLAEEPELIRQNLHRGLASLCSILGADEKAVMPCTHIPAELSLLYTNGVQVTGEHKSGNARRGYPVKNVHINFCNEPEVSRELLGLIQAADIMIMAPGSLYSSLIPVFQVPQIADAVKENKQALKILVSNLWVQTGETDLSITEPDRKFHLSDMLEAYDQNIPGGNEGLFDTVLCLSLKDVPATVIQSYAVEGKIPIYLDREKVSEQGIAPLECGIYSSSALREQGIIRHDPHQFALVVRTLWAASSIFDNIIVEKNKLKAHPVTNKFLTSMQVACVRYGEIAKYVSGIIIDLPKQSTDQKAAVHETLQNILWNHKDIPLGHLQFVKGVQCIADKDWKRNQNWDKVFSFFDPEDCYVKIRQDQFISEKHFEVAFLVALGQGLLGNYAKDKSLRDVLNDDGIPMGKVYHLDLRTPETRNCYFSEQELTEYLILARMVPDTADKNHFTRLVNGREGFTPPGLLMGLIYAWYLDNRFASHIEYKMAVMRIDHSDLIPEQVRMKGRREKLTVFFREVVFGH